MKARKRHPDNRRGVSLLEVMTAATLSSVMMMSSFVVLRSTYAAWEAHDADLQRTGAATAVLRHLIRNARQSVGVSAVSAATDTSGTLTFVDDAGETLSWNHSGDQVTLQQNSGTAVPLADGIQQLSFEGYTADGVTPTAEPDQIQAIRAVVTTSDPTGGSRTLSAFAWVRSW